MDSGIPVRFNGLGFASVVAGLLALIAVAMPQWVVPPPPRPMEVHLTLKDRIVEKLKNIGHKKERTRQPAGWREGVPFIAIVLALLAVLLGALAVLRGEEHLYSGVGSILGFGALAFQLTIMYGIAACIIQIMYAATERPAGAPVLAFIGVCGIAALSLMSTLGLDEDTALLLVLAALIVLGLKASAYLLKSRRIPPTGLNP
jgi:cation transport ATPase